MQDAIQKIFTSLKRITPDSGYLAQSKASILQSTQDARTQLQPKFAFSFFERLNITGAVALGALVLLVVGTAAFMGTPAGQLADVPSIASESLTREASEADFTLQISEAQYFDESAEQVAVALDQIADTKSKDENSQ